MFNPTGIFKIEITDLEPIRKVVYSFYVYGTIDLFDKAKCLYTIFSRD
jgi:hypothetical protein